MQTYTVRVELHGAAEKDYETLHAAMERRGFSRTVFADDGILYHMPTAEYAFSGSHPGSKIRDFAVEAASETLRRSSILVTRAEERFSYNLRPVAEASREQPSKAECNRLVKNRLANRLRELGLLPPDPGAGRS